MSDADAAEHIYVTVKTIEAAPDLGLPQDRVSGAGLAALLVTRD